MFLPTTREGNVSELFVCRIGGLGPWAGGGPGGPWPVDSPGS